jgi:hypothetical protein
MSTDDVDGGRLSHARFAGMFVDGLLVFLDDLTTSAGVRFGVS